MNILDPVAIVSPLRQRLIDEMEIRRFGRETQRNYIRDVGRFATFLQADQPELFDRYLYVGATRAATYLGLTCRGDRLPAKIAPLELRFGKDWR